MSRLRDLLTVAWAGLTARKMRTLLIMLGPIVGVAAMVGAVGLTESAKGDLKAKLSQLGTTLIEANAGGTFGQQNPTFPADAVARVRAIPTVAGAAATGELSGIVALPSSGTKDYYSAFPVPVQAADLALPQVLQVPLIDGRWLDQADVDQGTRAAVLGQGLAQQYGYLPGELRSIRLNDINYGVVGVLGQVELEPGLDNAVFITQTAAKNDFLTDGKPTKLYVRASPGHTRATADAIPTAVNLGGPESVTTKVPSDALAASAQADKTLQQTALFAGLLALAVGGLGIANVMSISVIQRSSEIGIRRAVGHTRSRIAAQFLLEALFVGIFGGLLGAVLGTGIVYAISHLAKWVVVMDYGRMPLWVGLAVIASIAAGLWPSIKAARLEPLATLRLG
ncbi:MAG TPA: ABC transporter permease [Acidimicrobiales bacterium]|nr:ABC transporter permease [Acidimicrobiales bacterium]